MMVSKENHAPALKSGILLIALIVAIALLAQPVFAAVIVPPGTIDPRTIPMFENELTGPPPVWVPVSSDGTDYYAIDVGEFSQQILPPSMGLSTPVWGYGGEARDAVTGDALGYVQNTPAGTFEATRDTPVQVTWTNDLTGDHLFPVDPTLHWANPNELCNDYTNPMMCMFTCANETGGMCTAYPPGYADAQSSVPIIPHLHGAEVQSTSDGHPDAWFTADGTHGDAYNSLPGAEANEAIFYYPNEQPPATLWYHDHALGITRINVLSGLAGFYLLRDPGNEPDLVAGPEYEIPLAIQDRTFNLDGSFWFDTVGLDPAVHPYWTPEHFGNTIMVNGMVWPNMDVNQTRYRFRLLDGSNARFYDIDFWDSATGQRIPFSQVGTDGGYLGAPVAMKELTIAPGERADIVVDFTGVVGPVVMRNRAKYPYPKGANPDPNTDGTIMQFTVNGPAVAAPPLPATLNTIPSLPAPDVTRTRVLWEVMGPLGPLEILLNGQKWGAEISEDPAESATEEWIIINPTADTHPIHLHLVQFQLISRQKIDINKYTADWLALQQQTLGAGAMPPWPDDYEPVELDITPYLRGKPQGPAANERGWKDTVQMNPGEVTIIRAQWAPIDGSGDYPFDPTIGPGYVWHCHILDHEDNEMMRPYLVV